MHRCYKASIHHKTHYATRDIKKSVAPKTLTISNKSFKWTANAVDIVLRDLSCFHPTRARLRVWSELNPLQLGLRCIFWFQWAELKGSRTTLVAYGFAISTIRHARNPIIQSRKERISEYVQTRATSRNQHFLGFR